MNFSFNFVADGSSFIFFQALSGIHKKHFEKNLKVIGTPEDELLSYWLSFDKNHPQRCVLRKIYVFV